MKRLTLLKLFAYAHKHYGIAFPTGIFPVRHMKLEFFTHTVTSEFPDGLVFAPDLERNHCVSIEFGKYTLFVKERRGEYGKTSSVENVLYKTTDAYVTDSLQRSVVALCPWIMKFKGDGLHIA